MKIQTDFIFLVCVTSYFVTTTNYFRGLYSEVFYDIDATIDNLRTELDYPHLSNFSEIVNTFETFSCDWISYCGNRIRGWFVSPQTGGYIFYTSCDDICQLYLSDDNDPLNARLIISQNSWTMSNNWFWYPSMQTSSLIYLKENCSYYIETVMLNIFGPGNSNVAVQMQNNATEPLTNGMMKLMKKCNSSSCIANNIEICFFTDTISSICTCRNGFSAINDQCEDIDECVDGTHDCNITTMYCTNTQGGYNCLCIDKRFDLVSIFQRKGCEKRKSLDDRIMPNLTVNFIGSSKGKSFLFILQIFYVKSFTTEAHNITIEFFLPPFLLEFSESISPGFTSIEKMKYVHEQPLTYNSSVYIMINATIDYELCPFKDFIMDISVKVNYQNLFGKTLILFKTYQNKIQIEKSEYLKINKNPPALSESYGRGIYYDEKGSVVYICINQYVSSTSRACFVTNDFGMSWEGLDFAVGSITGHHRLTNELYAIHRNQKLYLMFYSHYKKWISISNEEFSIQSKYLNHSHWKNLESKSVQEFTIGSKQWMGNAYGLFFRSNGTLIQLVKWPY